MPCPECKDTGWVDLFINRERCKQGCLPSGEGTKEVSEAPKNFVKKIVNCSKSNVPVVLDLSTKAAPTQFITSGDVFSVSTASTSTNINFSTGNAVQTTTTGGSITICGDTSVSSSNTDTWSRSPLLESPQWRKIYERLLKLDLEKSETLSLRVKRKGEHRKQIDLWDGVSWVDMRWLKELQALLAESLGDS